MAEAAASGRQTGRDGGVPVVQFNSKEVTDR